MTEPMPDLAAVVARASDALSAYGDNEDLSGEWGYTGVTVGDIRALLAALRAAQEDGARMRDVMSSAAQSLSDLADTDGAYLGGWAH